MIDNRCAQLTGCYGDLHDMRCPKIKPPVESCPQCQREREARYQALRKLGIARTCLERLRDCDWVISLPDRMDAVRDFARRALAEVEEQQ